MECKTIFKDGILNMLKEKKKELQKFKVPLAAKEVELAEVSGLPIFSKFSKRIKPTTGFWLDSRFLSSKDGVS